MIKKLKLRYLITNMSLLCGTLLIFLGVLFGFMYHAEVNASYRVIERMLAQANMPKPQMDEPSPAVQRYHEGGIVLLDNEIQDQPAETTPGFDPNQINPWENQWGSEWNNAPWGYNPWIYTPWIYNPWAYQWYTDPNNPYNNGDQNNNWGQDPNSGNNGWGYYQQPQYPDQQPAPPEQNNQNPASGWAQTPEEPSEPLPQNPQGQQQQQQPELPDDRPAAQQTPQPEPEPEPSASEAGGGWPHGRWSADGKWGHSIEHFVTTTTAERKSQTHTEAAKPDQTEESPAVNPADPPAPAQNPSADSPQQDNSDYPFAAIEGKPDNPYRWQDRYLIDGMEPRSVVPIQEGQYVPNAMIAQTDGNGNVSAYAGLSNSADEAEDNFNIVSNAWDKIRKTGSQQGVVSSGDYEWRYMRAPNGMLVLLDRTPELSMIRKLISIFLLIALFGIIVMFFVSWQLANWSVSPIAVAWEKQKQFVADASHELKTPLAVISANTEVVLANPGASVSGQSKWLNYIQSETMRMSKLISSLLSIARMDQPENSADESTVIMLSETVSNICLQFEPMIYENGKTLNTVIQRKVTIKAEEDNVKQLLSILLDNAVVHSVPKAQITVSLSKDTQGKIRLAVANTAKDIPKEQLEHLFDRFYRVDTEGSPNGSGLGLSIAKSIVHQMGGKINVTSENQLVTFTAVF